MSDDRRQEEVDSEASDYSYKDYSNVPIQQGAVVDHFASAICHKRAALFPAKLHEIVSNPEYEQIISWNPHGRSWEVKDKKLLVSVVAKEHFNHSNYESFNRLVNLWGFKRIQRAGPDYNSYYHQAFLRSRPDLTRFIKRPKKKRAKGVANVQSEPNFYQMRPLPMCRQPPLNGSGAVQEGASKDAKSNMQEFQVQPSTSMSLALQNAIHQQALKDAMQNAINQQALKDAMQNATQHHQCNMESSSFDNIARFRAPIAATTAQIDQANRSIQMTAQSGRGDNHIFELDKKPAASELNWNTGSISNASQMHERVPPTLPQLQQMEYHNTAALQANSDFQGPATAAFPPYSSMYQSISNLDHTAAEYQQPYLAASSFPDNVNIGNAFLDATEPFASSSQSRNSLNHHIEPTSIINKSTSGSITSNTKSAAAAPAALGLQSIALLSNPPAHPLLQEFARQYLPYFDNSSSDTADKDKSPEAEADDR